MGKPVIDLLSDLDPIYVNARHSPAGFRYRWQPSLENEKTPHDRLGHEGLGFKLPA